MPPPSSLPIWTALAMLVLAIGPLLHPAVIVVGALLTVAGIFAIAFEHLPARAATAAGEAEKIGTTGLDHRKVAIWGFLGSECLFFGTLISTYLVYKGRSLSGPTPHEILNIPLTSFSTFVLLMSSLTVVLAVSAIQRGDLAGTTRWLAGTVVGGVIFLLGQVYEFREFLHEGLGLTTNLFGSTFYVMVGFHGAHVSVGVLWLAVLWYLVRRGRVGPAQAVLVDIAGLYWHFVDVVWIAIFTLVYLIQ